MIVNENRMPTTDYQDVVVRVNKIIPLAPARERWNKVSVVVTAPVGGKTFPVDGQEVNLDTYNFSDHTIELERKELPKMDTMVRIFSLDDDTDLDLLYQHASSYGASIVYLSEASASYLAHDNKPATDMIQWLTSSATSVSDEYITYAGRANQAVMIDVAREGKLLYALLSLLSRSNSIMHTHQIINNTFAGITSITEAKQAEEKKLSYWFNSTQQVYPDGLFVGGFQAFKIYYDVLVEHRLKEAIAVWIQAGRTMSELLGVQNAMHSVGVEFANQMNPDITKWEVPSLSQLTQAQRISGTLPVTATYELLGEVRRVELTIKEAA